MDLIKLALHYLEPILIPVSTAAGTAIAAWVIRFFEKKKMIARFSKNGEN